MKPLKILHILDHSVPLHSGYTFRSQNIFHAQRNRGWEPVIVTSPKHEQSWKGAWQEKEIIRDFAYYRTGKTASGRFPFESELRLMAALTKRIRQVIKAEKPDILHAHSPVLNAIPALCAGWESGIPVIYEIRAFWEDAAADHGTYPENSWKYKLVRAIETSVCRAAFHVTVLCHGVRNDLMGRGISANKLTPVFNAINPDDFKPCPPDEQYLKDWNLAGKKVIAFIGSFYRYEGLDLLTEAFARISGKYPEAVLLLVGGGEMEKELKARIDASNLSEKVIMPGRIAHERIPGVYALADILVYPRHSMRLTELVTPLKPLEAMAMGKAFVASDVGGHKELVRHDETGLLFPAGNAAALAGELESLLNNEGLCGRLRSRGLAYVLEHRTWEKTTSVYADIYEKAIKSKETTR